MMDRTQIRRRALGAYFGLAVGDALGATVEFMTPREIVARFGGPHQRMVGGGWLRLRPGQVTDDTEMSLCLGRAILRSGGWDVRAAADSFAEWLKGGPIDVGNTCRRGIRRYLADGSLQATPNEGDAGNGAAMRILPLALATLGDPALFAARAIEQCHITHNHPFSDAATIAFGRMAQQLILGEGAAAARAVADGLVAAHAAFRFEPDGGLSSAYIVDTVRTVFHHFFRAESMRACLVRVVNQGGDADTAGAIAGMLAGAAFGVDAIPREWLERLETGPAKEIAAQVDGLLALAPAYAMAV